MQIDHVIPIDIVPEDLASFDAADDDMLKCARCIQSRAAWHDTTSPVTIQQVKLLVYKAQPGGACTLFWRPIYCISPIYRAIRKTL